MIIIIETNDGSSILSNNSLDTMLKIGNALSNNSEIGSKIEVSSIASVEKDAQNSLENGLISAQTQISDSLINPLSSLADNITFLKNTYKNVSDLSISLEKLAGFTDLYATLFYNFARGTFYLSNVTSAYDSYFNYSDYSLLEPYWNTSFTGPMNKIMTLQAYLGTFAYISQIRASSTIADTIINGLVFNFLNSSIYQYYKTDSQLNTTPYQISPLYQILLNLNQAWGQSFANYTTTTLSSIYGTLIGNNTITPVPSELINGSQLGMLSKLGTIAYNAFPTFANQTLTALSQSGMEQGSLSLQSFDLSSLLSLQVNDSLIEGFHLLPLGYMQLWTDIARNIFYLGNYTTAFEPYTSVYDPNYANTLSSIWLNQSSWSYDPTFTPVIFQAMNTPTGIPGVSLGNLTYNSIFNSPGTAENTVNSFSFSFLNSSVYLQYLSNPSSPNYLTSQEYLSLLTLNSSWTKIFNSLTIPNHIITNLTLSNIIGPQNAQLSLLNSLIAVTNRTFVDFAITSFNQLANNIITNNSSSTIPSEPSYGFSIPNENRLSQLTIEMAGSLYSQFNSSDLFNSTSLTPLLNTYIIPLAVPYRYNSTIPEPLLKPSVLGIINATLFNSGNNINITDFLSQGSFSGGESSLLAPYMNAIISTVNMTNIISQVYDTTIPNASISVPDIAAQTSTNIITTLHVLIPVPTLSNSLDQRKEVFEPILSGFVSSNNQTALLFVTFPGIEDRDKLNSYVEIVRTTIKDLMGSNSNYSIWVTGGIAISYDTDTSLEEDISRVDQVTVILVLALLMIVFLSFIAPIVPLAGIGMALVSALGTIYVVSTGFNFGIPSIMLSILTVVMLGAGVDYCLFVMWRYKEERQRGRNRYSSVKQSVIHAGESVASSGTTVMIGFGSLLLSSFSLLNQMGLGPMIGIGFSLLAALTLIPIGLYLFGDKLFWPRNFRKNYEKKLDQLGIDREQLKSNPESIKPTNNNHLKQPFLRKMAKFTVKHPIIIITLFVIFSLPFLYGVSQIQVSYDSVDFLPQGVEAVTGLQQLQGKFSLGQIFPVEVVLNFASPISDSPNAPFYNQTKLNYIEDFVNALYSRFKTTSNGNVWIDQINTITRPYGIPINTSEPLDQITLAQMQQFIGPTSNTTVIVNIEVGKEVEPIGPDALALVGQIREWRSTYQGPGHNQFDVLVGGNVSQFYEISNIINHESLFLVAAVMIGIFVVLFFITGSIFTPIRLELTILLSIVISLGAVQFYFVDFLGQGIPWMIPIMLFVLIFGLGMDYDIFIVTRMREEVAVRGATDEEAIITALEKTGTIITAAGIIMGTSLGSLFLASSNILKIMGFAFFFAIIIDATLIRQLLVPAMMVLAKKANWWNPIKRFQRVPSDEERARLRQIHNHRFEYDLIFNDLTDDELRYYEKDFKKDKKVIQHQREKIIGLMQKYWKADKRELRRMASQIDQINNIIHNITSKYESFRPQIQEALDIWIEDNTKSLSEVKALLNQISEGISSRENLILGL
ncbi:MAG: MMPL family transporter [Candidatus Thorarchaeota archaeon]